MKQVPDQQEHSMPVTPSNQYCLHTPYGMEQPMFRERNHLLSKLTKAVYPVLRI